MPFNNRNFFCSFIIATKQCQLINQPDVPTLLHFKVYRAGEYPKKSFKILTWLFEDILIGAFTTSIILLCIIAANEDTGVALNGIVSLQALAENTFLGHMEAEEGLHQKLLQLRDQNGGRLAIIYYVG